MENTFAGGQLSALKSNWQRHTPQQAAGYSLKLVAEGAVDISLCTQYQPVWTAQHPIIASNQIGAADVICFLRLHDPLTTPALSSHIEEICIQSF